MYLTPGVIVRLATGARHIRHTLPRPRVEMHVVIPAATVFGASGSRSRRVRNHPEGLGVRDVVIERVLVAGSVLVIEPHAGLERAVMVVVREGRIQAHRAHGIDLELAAEIRAGRDLARGGIQRRTAVGAGDSWLLLL